MTKPRFAAILTCSGAISLPVAMLLAVPATAQEFDPEASVYSGDYLTIGIGAAVSPSYSGSDEYVITPVPMLQGSIGGIAISPRAGGIALDFVPGGDKVDFDLGVAARLRSDRAVNIQDPVVESLGKLDRAIEVGPSVGVGVVRVFNPYDSLSFSTDVLWDVNGAHEGMVVSPGITYFTPLSRGIAASLSIGADWADDDFHDYYFRVTPGQSVATGGVLTPFAPGGSGFTSAGATLLGGVDLDGELTNGGWALFGIVGYSRLLGDARRTPFTSAVGTADQFLGAFGIGYTF